MNPALLLSLALTNPPPAELLSVPKVNLEYWNQDDDLRRQNNCYNYSTNRVTNSFAQPGEAGGAIYTEMTCAAVLEAASKDFGLERTEFFPFTQKADDTLIALVVAPAWDFHWYRRDADNHWTHKPGGTQATDKDHAGHPIEDPAVADRGAYTEFCGYFRIKNYPTEAHEQNAGYVRIGSMANDEPEMLTPGPPPVPAAPARSEVEVMMYSGRRNPRYRLKDMLKDKGFRATVLGTKERLENGVDMHAMSVTPTNGGQRFLIIDREGLVFEKGTSVEIEGVVTPKLMALPHR